MSIPKIVPVLGLNAEKPSIYEHPAYLSALARMPSAHRKSFELEYGEFVENGGLSPEEAVAWLTE